jgi:FKBP-type peptidyl-prolyl cis-trans isomerase FkpA
MKRIHLLLALLVAASACNNDVTGLAPPSDPATETFDASLNVTIATMTRLPGGTYIKDLVVGTGDSVVANTDTVWVTYSGRIKTGKLFDSGTNSKFQPGALIAGFRAGMIGMRVGGRRQIVIPSEQGYGARSIRGSDGKISIPRQSTLIFDVQLLKLHTPADTTTATP